MLWHLLHSYSLHNYVSGLCSDEASAMALAVLSSAKLRQVLWHCRLSGLVNLRRVLVSSKVTVRRGGKRRVQGKVMRSGRPK